MEIIDKLFIQPCSNEVQNFWWTPENEEGRPDTSNRTVKAKCSSKDYTKCVSTSCKDECTYQGKLEYLPFPKNWRNCSKISPQTFWEDLTGNILEIVRSEVLKNVPISFSGKDGHKIPNLNQTRLVVLLVSHPDRIQKLILPSKTATYANGSCMLVSSNENQSRILFKGIGDQGEHFTPLSQIVNAKKLGLGDVSKNLQIVCGYLNLQQVDVLVCGNAQPCKVQKLDSMLTQLGEKQANVLGKQLLKEVLEFKSEKTIVIPMASYLNRSQHTALLCLEAMLNDTMATTLPTLNALLDLFKKNNTVRVESLKKEGHVCRTTEKT